MTSAITNIARLGVRLTADRASSCPWPVGDRLIIDKTVAVRRADSLFEWPFGLERLVYQEGA
jgi:hypothetical protein